MSAVERSMSASNCAHAKKHGLSQYGRSESAVRARLTAMGAQQERDFCLAVKVDFAVLQYGRVYFNKMYLHIIITVLLPSILNL